MTLTETDPTHTASDPATDAATDAAAGPHPTEELAERIVGSLTAGMELLSIELGRRLGLYDLLASEPRTAGELASAAGIARRYAEEWLTQQAVGGLLTRVDERFALPAEHAPVLVDDESPANVLGAAPLLLAVARALPAVASAYSAGEGVPFDAFGPELRMGIAMLNRPTFRHGLGEWMTHLPDVAARLRGGGTILDVGCGVGWSTLALAEAFPDCEVVGVDLDEASIDDARRHAAAAGVGERVRFVRASVLDEPLLRRWSRDGYDLVTAFQALHDMGSPDRALAVLRRLLAPGGAVLVGDEHPGADVGGPVERLQRAVSALHCAPATWAESDRVVNGTVLETSTLRDWARGAGFGDIQVLSIEHPFWRFHRLDPREQSR
jgi:SAM-dependent methyltransferase